METKNFWRDKKVLVTGSGGFVGSHITDVLVRQGAFVVGLTTSSALNKALSILNYATVQEIGDVRDLEFLKTICSKHRIDTVFHLAAAAIVSKAAHSPLETIQTNVVGTLHVLEAARLCGVSRVVIASSDKAYGDHADDVLEKLPYKEDYGLRGLDMYSSSKVCADTIAQAYAFQFKIPIAVVRSCNIYGPGDINFTRLIPKTVMRLLLGQPPTIKKGHELVLREYIHVNDVAAAYLYIAENLERYHGPGGSNMPVRGRRAYGWLAFNVGSYSEAELKNLPDCLNIRNVKQVIDALSTRLNGLPSVEIDPPKEYIEIPDEYLDSSKVLGLGFKPQYTFDRGLDECVAWYKNNFPILKHIYEKN